MSIGGALDYQRLANLHRPSGPERLAEEVKRLSSQGLTQADISTALQTNMAVVLEMLNRSHP